jgi:hypothetical protein
VPAFIGAVLAAAESEPLASPGALPAADSLVAAKGDAPLRTEAAFVKGAALAADEIAAAAALVMDGAGGEVEAPEAPTDPSALSLADALETDDACGPDAPADAA